jgi:hypothetical protein
VSEIGSWQSGAEIPSRLATSLSVPWRFETSNKELTQTARISIATFNRRGIFTQSFALPQTVFKADGLRDPETLRLKVDTVRTFFAAATIGPLGELRY